MGYLKKVLSVLLLLTTIVLFVVAAFSPVINLPTLIFGVLFMVCVVPFMNKILDFIQKLWSGK